MRLHLHGALLALGALGLFTSAAWAQGNASGQGAATATPAPQAAAPAGQAHPLAVSVARIGAFACVERANQIANFLDASQTSQVIVPAPENGANQRLLISSMVIPSGNATVIAGVALAPAQANGCGGSYRVLSYSELPCRKAIEKLHPTLKFNKLDRSDVELAVASRTLWIMAMPAGTGCVFNKEEIVQ